LPYSYKLDFNKKNKPYILVLAGPTGVGKTTSIAKLGAIYSLVLGKKIAFMTLDTYRLAAVEQLQKYAEILDVPLKIIFKPENFNSLLDDLNEYDIILVDTAGRNPKDEEQMMELKKFLNNTDKASETFLVVQATTKFSDLEEIIKRFENINFDKLLITKLDETITFGPIVNLLEKYKYDVSYITNGQEVPDAIEKFNPSKLAQAIIYKHPF
jgi:flagellar biosynthesis protein FlhF